MAWVYFLTNRTNSTLYIGVTRDIHLRIEQHRSGMVPGFTSRYRLKKLVYAEAFDDLMDAVQREKELKGWTRARKNRLIEKVNPSWEECTLD